MIKVVRCECGGEIRNTDEQSLIQATQKHASDAHKLALTDEQVLAMMEVEQ